MMDELQRDFYKLMMTVYLLTLQFMKKEKTIFYSSGRTASTVGQLAANNHQLYLADIFRPECASPPSTVPKSSSQTQPKDPPPLVLFQPQ